MGGAHRKGGGDAVLLSGDSEALTVLVRAARELGLTSQLVISLSQATTIVAIHVTARLQRSAYRLLRGTKASQSVSQSATDTSCNNEAPSGLL